MWIATWNVNSIRARRERVLEWLDRRQPDILCLQETKVVDQCFPREDFEARGYALAIHGQKTYNGVAILSRQPITEVVTGLQDPALDEQARVIAGTVAGLRVYSVYVPNGKALDTESYSYKLRWLDRLLAHLSERASPRDAIVIGGDYNIAPADPDVWDPDRWRDQVICSDAERQRFQALLSWGLVDAYRLHHDEAGHYSWWDYRQLAFPKGRGLRIDHILLTRAAADHCLSAEIDRDARKGKQPSDHAPVCVELQGPA